MEQKHGNVLDVERLDGIGNKFMLIIEASNEAKRLKQQDKDNTSLGQISIEGINRVLHKKLKESKKEEEK